MANPAIAAAAISGGGSILTSGLNYLFNRKLAKYQYELDQQAIDRQNAYNSPVQQMARYKEAGLNPNMIYGSGGSAGNQTEVPRFDAPRVNFENPLQGAISTYFDARLKTAQQEDIEAQALLKQAQTEHEKAKQLETLLNVDKKTLDNQWLRDTYDMRVQSLLLDLNQKDANISNTRQVTDNLKKQAVVIENTGSSILQSIEESKQRVTESQARVLRLFQDYLVLVKRARQMDLDYRFASETYQDRKESIKYGKEIKGFERDAKSWLKDFRTTTGLDLEHFSGPYASTVAMVLHSGYRVTDYVVGQLGDLLSPELFNQFKNNVGYDPTNSPGTSGIK